MIRAICAVWIVIQLVLFIFLGGPHLVLAFVGGVVVVFHGIYAANKKVDAAVQEFQVAEKE